MPNFIEFQEFGKSEVLIDKRHIIYITPYSKAHNEPKTSIMLTGGIILTLKGTYEEIKKAVSVE